MKRCGSKNLNVISQICFSFVEKSNLATHWEIFTVSCAAKGCLIYFNLILSQFLTKTNILIPNRAVVAESVRASHSGILAFVDSKFEGSKPFVAIFTLSLRFVKMLMSRSRTTLRGKNIPT